ncbi:MAG: succinate dehydrogenase, cytochrome b556 subunit [Gammaproteobacteria bacterium]|nr:succinate dehydrogenase, cytochrome b556 subunit [Gammaproteobacteria bacterium]
MAATDSRPFFLNLIKIRLPVQGMVSIFHRVTGVLMFIAIPFMAWLLDMSLQGEQGFSHTIEILSAPFSLFVIAIMTWSLVHHLLAGIRYLFIDFELGLSKQQSRYSAWLVFIIEFILLVLLFWVVCL